MKYLVVGSILLMISPALCAGWMDAMCGPTPVVKQSLTTRTVVTTRAPRGHTHTCAHGHTWDHDANPTHTCKFCGMTQYVVDPSPRPVTIVRTVTVDAPATQVVQAHTFDHKFDHQAVFSIPGLSAGGCANGQCSTISRGGILGRR